MDEIIEVDGKDMHLDKFCRYDGEVTFMIRSDKIKSYIKLKDWLISKNLPFLERWSFYLSGKLGEYPDPYKRHYVYYWKEYLSFTEETVKNIIAEYIAKNNEFDLKNIVAVDPLYFKRPIESYLPEDNIYWGWNWVIDQIDKDIAEIQTELENQREPENYNWYDPFEGHGNWGHGDGW